MSHTQHNFVTHHLSNTTFTHNFVNQHLSHTFFHAQFSHTTLSHTIFHTPSFTHHFVTHRLSTLLDTPRLPPATRMSHTTQLCHATSFTHNFHTQLSHTTLSTSIFHRPSFTHNFHTQVCHTPSFTHPLSHTLLSHTIFNTPSLTSLMLSDNVGPSTNCLYRRVTQVELAFALRNLSPYHPMMFAAWVAPACFIFRHVFCFASFLLLACLRSYCCGMFYGCSGMFMFRHVSSVGLFRHV